jgi:hypothetical protein
MPKLEYFLLCESISVDQETNRVSLFHVLEDLHLAKFPERAAGKPPFILNQFVAVALFNRLPEDQGKEFEACLTYELPDGSEKEHKLHFQMESNRQRLIMRFVGMPPPNKDGLLHFVLRVNGEHQGTHTIQLFAGNASNEDSNPSVT